MLLRGDREQGVGKSEVERGTDREERERERETPCGCVRRHDKAMKEEGGSSVARQFTIGVSEHTRRCCIA